MTFRIPSSAGSQRKRRLALSKTVDYNTRRLFAYGRDPRV